MFLRWKNAVLQMLETWLSKERLLSNSTPRFLTDEEEELTEQNWFTPHMCGKTYWIRSLLQIVTCECATARVGGARPSTIDAWQCFLFDIRDFIKE